MTWTHLTVRGIVIARATGAAIAVDSISTDTTVEARRRNALVDVVGAKEAVEAWRALARKVADTIFAGPAVPARR